MRQPTNATRDIMPEDPDWWRRYDAQELSQPKAAALEEFVRLGYHGTSIRRIAATAGMTVPGLYYHFRSKQDILNTLLLNETSEMIRRRDAALASVRNDPYSRFVVQVENSTLHTMYRQDVALLLREIRFLNEPARSQIIALRDDLESSFYAEIQRCQDAGIFLTTDARRVGRAILALCRSIAGWYCPGGPQTAEEITRQYVHYALLLAGNHD